MGVSLFTKDKTNVCKGIGILFLLFHHLFRKPEIILNNNIEFNFISIEKINIIATALRVCVWIFAFLSAYGLAYKYKRSSKEDRHWFVPRQWLNLMKPFWFIYLFAVCVYIISGHNIVAKYSGNFLYAVFDFFAVADFFGTPKLLGVFWYMFFAQLVVFALPVIFKFCEKFGYLSILFSFIFMFFLKYGISTLNGGPYLEYLIVVVTGVVFVQKDVMNRLSMRKSKAPFKLFMFILFLCIAAGAMYLREIIIPDDTMHLRGVCSAVAAASICISFGVYLNIRFITIPLSFLGKYSGGMFIIHSMLYSMVPRIVYLTSNPALVYLILIAESLLITMAVFVVKKYIRYDKLFELISKGICKIPVFFFGKQA